jgi:hypothetical protein
MTRRLLALIAALALPATAAAQGDFHWTGKLTPGQRIELKGVNGSITAKGGAGATAEVTARKTARHSDPNEVEIKVVPFDGGVTICAVYPTPRRADRENSCEPGHSWHSNTTDNDVVVDFTVTVPAGVVFAGQTVNGDVSARSLTADVEAHTVNGGIDVSTTGHADASTVNGSIEATLGKADWDDVQFTTVNGGITLTLPTNLSTDVEAQTVNGDLESDFPLTIIGKFGRHRMNGTIGQGGRRIKLVTVNGDIRLLKAS